MDYNLRPETTHLIDNFLQINVIRLTYCPARVPDLILIEYVWGALESNRGTFIPHFTTNAFSCSTSVTATETYKMSEIPNNYSQNR